MESTNKILLFDNFVNAINDCTLCSRLCSKVKVLSKFNGNINTKVIFIAEAPGRLGAQKTAIPLYGDRTGENFELLLSNIGWNRDQVFITNAVLCNPINESGNNDKPSKEEITNCSSYLEMTINLINPVVIVTLGITALESLKKISPHNYILKDNVGQILDWNGYKLMPLYHPGPRAVLHRNLHKQRSDFIELANKFNPISGYKKKKKPDFVKEVEYDNFLILMLIIISEYHIITYFKLTKIMYLVDWYMIQKYGSSFSRTIYLRQKDGPWPPELPKKLKQLEYEGIINTSYVKNILSIEYVSKPLTLKNSDIEIIKSKIKEYISLDNSKMKFLAYRTKPMRFILEEEKKGKNFLNKPVLFGNTSVLD
jgi:uracil-DNA glycosylase family 4